MPIHTSKSRKVSKTISGIIDYVENTNKTNNGELITAYRCDSRTADTEFYLSQKQYNAITGREQGKGGILAYHIRQSFMPGEITPKEANRIGYELALAFTKNNHQFIVATHVDRKHIHNHIIFNSITLDCSRKFNNFFYSSIAIRKISDRLCLENGLSIVENPSPGRESYGKWLGDNNQMTWQDKLRHVIDKALEEKPIDITAFISIMKTMGYEVKEGKHLSFRAQGQQRFTRLRSLGEDYTDAAVIERIQGKRTVVPKHSKSSPPKLKLLIDLQNSIKAKDSPGVLQYRGCKSYTLYFIRQHKRLRHTNGL